MYCATCNQSIQPQSAFCQHCGAALSQERSAAPVRAKSKKPRSALIGIGLIVLFLGAKGMIFQSHRQTIQKSLQRSSMERMLQQRNTVPLRPRASAQTGASITTRTRQRLPSRPR